jgi:hypothetical protein
MGHGSKDEHSESAADALAFIYVETTNNYEISWHASQTPTGNPT